MLHRSVLPIMDAMRTLSRSCDVCGRSRGVAKFVCAVVHDALKSRGKRGIFDGTGSFRCLRCDVATCSPCLAQSVQSGAARSLVGPVIAWEKQSGSGTSQASMRRQDSVATFKKMRF